GSAGVWCESASAVVSNCVVTGNQGDGGAYGGTLNNCILSDNTVAGPAFSLVGGGAAHCTLNNCTLTGNSASETWSIPLAITPNPGGGAAHCTLSNCTLSGNITAAYGCTLKNCAVLRNSGIGAYESVLNNCTLIGNSFGAQD